MLESKVKKIVDDMKQFQEDERDETEELSKLVQSRKSGRKFKFKPVTEEKMAKVMRGLPRKTSSGEDGTSYVDLADGLVYTGPLLTKIFNGIVATSHWPSAWRNSVLKPLFKGGKDRRDPGGYRPVALTCAASRVVERLLNEQLAEFLEEEELNLEENHGFRKGRGCSTAVLEIFQELQEGVEEGNIPTLLGIDISSAFDCLDRDKLAKQLIIMGLGEEAVELVRDYFDQRTQQVEIGGELGEKRPSSTGVLQGSGLSPLLFFIYVIRGAWCQY